MDRLARYPGVSCRLRRSVAIMVVGVGWLLWGYGAADSPALDKARLQERKYVEQILILRAPDYAREKALAEAYWQRYPDVRDHWLWGRQGTMGVRGPREHYRLHGRREGRVWEEPAGKNR